MLNAANEVAVDVFLDGKLGFTSIPAVIERTMNAHSPESVLTIDVIRRVDVWAREQARAMAAELELIL